MTRDEPPPLPAGLGPVRHATRLSGGMVATVWSAEADRRPVVIKATPYDARLEAEGLEALGRAGAPVPEVLGVDEQVLVLEHVEGDGDWGRLGAALAEVHRQPASSFGWHQDNVIGPLPQDNEPHDDWPEFYVERRIRPHLELPDLPAPLRLRLRAACEDDLPALLDHGPTPSLVHGDLWSGNVVGGAFLIDPAVHHADREFELAFAALFGGIPQGFWDGYVEVWPLDDGWERRRPALQLYHLLVHVALFGGTYVGSVRDRLDQLGW